MGLNLFPVRAAIGTVQADGSVLMTPEFSRALADLLERVGGETNLNTDDINTLLTDQAAQPLPPEIPQQFLPPPEFGQVMAEVAALRQQVEELQQRLSDQVAARADFSDLEQLTAIPTQPPSSYLADLEQLLNDPPPVNVIDWERPGRIGFRVPNSAAFTTLTASGLVTLSPANANVVLSPTGTGVVTIAPATAGSMNNVAIGAVTPLTVAATTITATGEVRVTQPIGGAAYGMWSVAAAAASRNFSLAAQSVAYGQCELWISNARLGDPVAAGTVVWSGTASGFKVTAAFGCNGAAVQTAAASGGAMATTAATNVSPYGFTTAAQADSIATKLNAIRAALVANGIMS